ncbi:hypothetical protein HMPREF9446_01707 [Bacteroides fluxus YIT 12057]|uniref:Uncharacterized protein n=1 Tax=Bacteroides fluxus YIT 12057 TaxID=763034 RepID=F3PSH2_9BACE|nr:hypothetical protein HMPREF9446_01707 [Bacteroides fluxus YIT 12057]
MALDSLVAEDLNGIMREIVQGKNNDSGERIRGMCIVGGYRKEGEYVKTKIPFPKSYSL